MDDDQPDGRDGLYEAALAGDPDRVRTLLQEGADVNDANHDNGWTVLMVAAATDHAEVVEELVGQDDLEVNARAEDGRTALFLAAERGRERVVEQLLTRSELDPNAKDSLGRTGLIVAAFNGHAGVVERLLADRRTDPNLVDRDRQTALHWAALGGHTEVARALLGDERTNPGIANRPDGNTAQAVAAAAGKDDVAALLEERMGRDPGSDELSPGDDPGLQVEEAPLFFERPFVPEPPDLRDPDA